MLYVMCMLCKSENLCFLNLYSLHSERILENTEERNTFKTLKTFPLCRNRYNKSIF